MKIDWQWFENGLGDINLYSGRYKIPSYIL